MELDEKLKEKWEPFLQLSEERIELIRAGVANGSIKVIPILL